VLRDVLGQLVGDRDWVAFPGQRLNIRGNIIAQWANISFAWNKLLFSRGECIQLGFRWGFTVAARVGFEVLHVLPPFSLVFELRGIPVLMAQITVEHEAVDFLRPVKGVDSFHVRFPFMLPAEEGECFGTFWEQADIWLEVPVHMVAVPAGEYIYVRIFTDTYNQ
jgi:hypothetical protein